MSHKHIVDHLESFLGPIDYGWKDNGSGNAISIVRFRNQPVEGMSTYATLGLSHHVLFMLNKREVRQEFVFATFDSANVVELQRGSTGAIPAVAKDMLNAIARIDSHLADIAHSLKQLVIEREPAPDKQAK